MKRLVIFAVLAAVVFCGCINPKKIHVPADETNIEIDGVGCRIERYKFHSDVMDKDIDIAIVLPPNYDKDSDKTYPVVYALHGARAPYDTYANMGRFRAALVDMPMIYTCFQGELSSYLDSPKDPKMQYTTFFFDEFIPFVEKTYRANGQRGVTGFSMGGSGALHYTMCKPEMFVATCAMSTGARKIIGNTDRGRGYMERRFGPYEENKEFYESIDCWHRTEQHFKNGTKLPKLKLCCGTEDGAIVGLRQYRDFLVELNGQKRKEIAKRFPELEGSKLGKAIDKAMDSEGIDFEYSDSPGRHAWAYWHGQAPKFARFFWEAFQNDAKMKAQTEKETKE